jgi:hypothetical protein
MVLTKAELLASLQHEVRILLHLTEKIDRDAINYRPTSKQRSTLELLQYLSFMGPALIRYAIGHADMTAWGPAKAEADARNFDQTVAAIARQKDEYEKLLAALPDNAFRAEIKNFDGSSTSAGAFIVRYVLGGCAAYRTQLFVYLKACGREELTTRNLWAGVDAPAAVS